MFLCIDFYLNNNDLEFISKIFKDKFNVKITHKLESKGIAALYIENNNQFSVVIKPYLSPSLRYKLNNPHNKFAL